MFSETKYSFLTLFLNKAGRQSRERTLQYHKHEQWERWMDRDYKISSSVFHLPNLHSFPTLWGLILVLNILIPNDILATRLVTLLIAFDHPMFFRSSSTTSRFVYVNFNSQYSRLVKRPGPTWPELRDAGPPASSCDHLRHCARLFFGSIHARHKYA